MTSLPQQQLDRDGFALLRGALTGREVDELLAALASALEANHDPASSVRQRGGSVYAARNVLALCTPATEIWQRPALVTFLGETLGADFGLVRGLYFDKHPEWSWSLPWHADQTIAVQRNDLPSPHFSKPTHKAGVPHVEASREVLQRMLTLRLHLDDVTEENGPLLVLPGSHRGAPAADAETGPAHAILADRGDVLAMRPLLLHSSGHSHKGTTRHRRVLHLEFTGQPELPDGYRWHFFLRPGGTAENAATRSPA